MHPRIPFLAGSLALVVLTPAGPASADDADATGGLAITIPLGEDGAGPADLNLRGEAEGGWGPAEGLLAAPATQGDPELDEVDRLPRLTAPDTAGNAPDESAEGVDPADRAQVVQRAVGDPAVSDGLVYLPPAIEPGPPGAPPLPESVLR